MLLNKSALIAAAALAAVAVAGTGIAQAPAGKPGAVDPARVSGGTYTADKNHTLVGWRVDHFGFNDYFGIFGDVTGTLTVDPANPAAAKVDVTIPINPTVASAGLRDHLVRPGKDGKAPDFFGPGAAPARFVSRTVTVGADGRTAYIVGDLTLNGRTAPVAMQATFTGAGANPMSKAETIGFEARALLKRSQFGLTYGIPMIGDEVELDISAAFEKSAGEPAPRPEPGPNACNADKATPWIGKEATEAVRAEVAKATGAKAIRWIGRGMAVTADYRPDRLNVSLAAKTDVIVKASCG